MLLIQDQETWSRLDFLFENGCSTVHTPQEFEQQVSKCLS